MRVFAYGSNLCHGRMQARVPSARVLGLARLVGHTLRFHKRSQDLSGKANAFATDDPDDQVWGVIIEIEPRELPQLDRAEGEGHGYHRRELTVLMDGMRRVSAFVYLAEPDAIDEGLVPYGWYKRFVVEGARRHGLPADYVDALAAAESLDDPDPGRDRREPSQPC